MENNRIEEKKHELIEDIEVIWEDIIKMHNELVDGSTGEHCVEIRPIIRKANKKGICDKAGRSFHMWKADDKVKSRFKEWYEKNVLKKGACLFVSVHNFDSNIEAIKENGKKYKKYSINKFNQRGTRVLVADLDGITPEENQIFDEEMKRLKIPFQSLHTSPDGYQKRFYLKEDVADEFAVSKFTKLLYSKGYKVDQKLSNRGQIVRLNGSINNKCFSVNFPERTKQFMVKELISTDNKISVIDLWMKLDSLTTLKYNVKVEKINEELVKDIKNIKTVAAKEYDENTFKENYSRVIPIHYLKDLQRPIKHMLIDAKEGYTDHVIMFLIPYFKNTLNLSFEQTYEIFKVWSELNGYNEIDKVERIYYSEYKYGFGIYTDKLAKKYGSIDFKKKYDMAIKINNDTVNLKPGIFNREIYADLNNTTFKVYIGILFEYKASGKDTWILEDVISYNGISRKTAIKCLKELVDKKFISCIKFFRGEGRANEYIITRNYLALKTEHRVEFTLSELDRMFSKLKGNEIKTFVFMKFMVLRSKGYYFGNQEDIAKSIGISRNQLSTILKQLEKKRFLNIEKKNISPNIESNGYTLIF